jgi:hypothetical protein
MIKIKCNNLEEISNRYLDRLKGHKFRKTNPITIYYIDNIEDIIMAKPSAYKLINDKFQKLYDRHKKELRTFRTYMGNQYKRMCAEDGYWLAKELNVNTCPYCNRQYTFTIDKQKRIRPQFDHFLSKSEYPHLALSFYNLIPCCPTCNHIKSVTSKELIYPYDEGFHNKCQFQVNHTAFMLNNDQIKLELITMSECDTLFMEKCKNSIDTFALKELYEQHSDYIEEIIIKAYSYNHDYYDGLIENFSKMGKNKNEMHRLIFGNYIDRANNEQRPLSKLTSDLLEQIGIVE